jgi:UbiD family decarboxylase
MSLRSFLEKIDDRGELIRITKPISKKLEIAAVLRFLNGKPVIFESVKESDFKVVGNICSTKQRIAEYLDTGIKEILPKIINAIENPTKPNIIKDAPCQEIIKDGVDLDRVPILFHYEGDGGYYISSGIMMVKDKEGRQNASYHRGMQIGKDRVVIRVLQRHLDEIIKRNDGEVDAAFCIGSAPNVLLASAVSVGFGKDEIEIANTLSHLDLVKCKTTDIFVPADTEIVLEGRITKEMHEEGPFVDLTEMYDIVREQPVFKIKKITHRKDAVYQALLPGDLEHKLLMGMPKEPTIYKEVNKVADCIDINISPGGCSWLHAIVQINKHREDDGKNAIEAAFRGHKSCKHVFIVDSDIDILNPLEIEWALATRFQANRDLVIKDKETGSSLDPSADHKTRLTCKAGFDLTKPLISKGKGFEKIQNPSVNVKKFME